MTGNAHIFNPSSRQMAMLGIPDLPEEAFGSMTPVAAAARKYMGPMPLYKKGGFGRILGALLSIVIPFAAPAISSAIGLSAGLTSLTGGAMIGGTSIGGLLGAGLVGGVMGGTASVLGGGKFGQGALMGTIGGGIGAFGAPTPASGEGAAAAANTAAGASTVAPTAAPTLAGAVTPEAAAGMLSSDVGAAANAGAADIGQQLGGAAAQITSGGLQGMPAATPFFHPDYVAAAGGSGSGAANIAAGGLSKDAMMRLGMQMAGSLASGPAMSPEEQRLMDMQTAELQRVSQQNQLYEAERANAARKLMGESEYFNPEYYGGMSQKAYQVAAGRAEDDALRKYSSLNENARESEARRLALSRAAGGQTAYLQGADAGEQNRIRTFQAGANLLPTSTSTSAMSGFSPLMTAYDNAYNRQRQQAGDVGTLYGSIFDYDNARKKDTKAAGVQT